MFTGIISCLEIKRRAEFLKKRGVDALIFVINIMVYRGRAAEQHSASEMETHEYRSRYLKATPTWESCQRYDWAHA